MRRRACFVFSLTVVGALVFGQAQASGGAASQAVQDVIKMARAGVDERILMAYVRTLPAPIALSADDVLALRAAGVADSVVAETRRPDTRGSDITEDQLFRLYCGRLF